LNSLDMEIMTASSESEKYSETNRASHDTGTVCMTQMCTIANPTGTIVADSNPTGATGAGANPTGATSTMVAAAETYWEPHASSHGDDLKLFLRLFEPASGALSKRKPEQWAFILEKIVPQLLEAAFIAKEQAIPQRLVATDAELRELNEVKEDPEEDVDETEKITTDMNS
jgi:hypothetical protein